MDEQDSLVGWMKKFNSSAGYDVIVFHIEAKWKAGSFRKVRTDHILERKNMVLLNLQVIPV